MSYLTFVDTNLRNYINKINHFPMLEEQEEIELMDKWLNKGCMKSVQKLIASHLRLVVKIAHDFRFYGLAMMDMVQEGNFGLMTAAKKFNPEKKCRFSTYSMLWIKAKIQNFILNSWSLVKINTTNSKRKLFFGLRKILKKLGGDGQEKSFLETTSLIAKEMNMPIADVKDVYNVTMNETISLNDKLSNHNNSDDNNLELMDKISDKEENHEQLFIQHNLRQKQKKILLESLQMISEREREIFLKRNASPKTTLEDLAQKFQVSKERIRQIEKSVLKKLRQLCTADKNKELVY